MKENGSMIRQRDLEYILTWTEQDTLVNGKKTNSMAKVKKHGLMEQCMKVNIH